MLPAEHQDAPITRASRLKQLLQVALQVTVGRGSTQRDFIKSQIGRDAKGMLKVSAAGVIHDEVKGPSHQVTRVEHQSGFVPVIELFAFTVDDEEVSVAMGAGGAVVAKITIQSRAQLNFVRLCLETVLGLIETRHEALVGSASTVFFGAGVGIEVRRRSIAVRMGQLVFTARTPAEVVGVIERLNQVLLEVKSRPSRCVDQQSNSGRVAQNFQVAG